MEKEEGWIDVKKKGSRKSELKNSSDSGSNDTGADFNSYCNTDVKVVAPRKPLQSSSQKTHSNTSTYQPPSMRSKTQPPVIKNKSQPFRKNAEDRGNRGNQYPRSGKWGRRGDIASIPDFENDEEKEKFTELQKICPHIVMPGTARREVVILRIDNYVNKILSDEWINLQCDGWQFIRIVKPDDTDFEIPEDGEYDLINLENKYNDFALFKKIA